MYIYKIFFLTLCLANWTTVNGSSLFSSINDPEDEVNLLISQKANAPLIESDFIIPLIPKEITNLPQLSEQDLKELRKIHDENVKQYAEVREKLRKLDEKKVKLLEEWWDVSERDQQILVKFENMTLLEEQKKEKKEIEKRNHLRANHAKEMALISQKASLIKLLSPAKKEMLEQHKEQNRKDIVKLQEKNDDTKKAYTIIEKYKKSETISNEEITILLYHALNLDAFNDALKKDEKSSKVLTVYYQCLKITKALEELYKKLDADQQSLRKEINTMSNSLEKLLQGIAIPSHHFERSHSAPTRKSEEGDRFTREAVQKINEIQNKALQHLNIFLKSISLNLKETLKKISDNQINEINNRLAHIALADLCLKTEESKRMTFEQFNFYRTKIASQNMGWKEKGGDNRIKWK